MTSGASTISLRCLKRCTILIISHQERILNIADKIIVVAGGEVVEYDECKKVFPKLIDVQSGCRYTKNM